MNYFHCTFVGGLCWIDEAANVRLIALSQSLFRSALLLVCTERICLAVFVGITLDYFMLFYLLAVHSVDYVYS